MKRPRPRGVAVLPLLLLLASGLLGGCATTGDAPDDQIKELQDRVLELQRKTAVADVEIARLRQQVADLMARQGMGGAAGGPPPAGTGAAPAPGAASWRRPAAVVGSAPGVAHPPGQAAAGGPGATGTMGTATAGRVAGGASARGGAIDEMDIDVPPAAAPASPISASGASRRPTGASAPQIASTPAPPPPVPSSGAAVQGPAAAGTEGHREPVTPAVQALYDRGYTLYHQKHYVDAETSFQRFLQAEPNSELADNAQYWIGECRYSRGDMRGALAAFRETVTRYPAGNKTADAMLKAGMSLENLGDKEEARKTYQEVLRRFPGTAVAAVAEERRAKLP